jgi:hypothetical protein
VWFFDAKLPLDPETRSWVDDKAEWIVGQLGRQAVQTAAVIEPTSAFFPDPFEANKASIERLLRRVCLYMEVDTQQVELAFFTESDTSPKAPRRRSTDSERWSVAVPRAQHADEKALAATMAHELAVWRLLRWDWPTEWVTDLEGAADLFTVMQGLGIITANVRFHYEQRGISGKTGWKNWSIHTQGYLSEEAFGYALALFAHIRDERSPGWSRYLNTNVHTYFRQSLRFMTKASS